jgi:hypothetical protein
VPPPQPLAGRQFRALQGHRCRSLQLSERLEQPGQRCVTARHLIHPADRLGDLTGLDQLPHAGLEVAEKRQVHSQGPTRIPLLRHSVELLGDLDRLLAQRA